MSRKHSKKARKKRSKQARAAWHGVGTHAAGKSAERIPRPLPAGNENDPADAGYEPIRRWQETHSPTEAVTVTLATAIRVGADGRTFRIVREQQLCRRRRDDARLFDSLSERQQRAFELIAHAFRVLTSGSGWKVRNLELVGRTSPVAFTESQLELRDRYRAWSDACRKDRLHIGHALDIIVFGLSCRALDRESRVRNGGARTNLVACLDLWR